MILNNTTFCRYKAKRFFFCKEDSEQTLHFLNDLTPDTPYYRFTKKID